MNSAYRNTDFRRWTVGTAMLVVLYLSRALDVQYVGSGALSKSGSAVIGANASFAIDLYKELARTPARDGKNLFYSPTSISMSLAMLLEGARGRTAEQICDVTHFSQASRDGAGGGLVDPNDRRPLHAAMAWLYPRVQSIAGSAAASEETDGWNQPYELAISSSVAVEKSFPINSGFSDAMDRYYGAGRFIPADLLTNPNAERAKINALIADQTHQKIKELIPQSAINTLTRLMITNAAYFKGSWSQPFARSNTTQRTFNLDRTNTVMAEMMRQSPMSLGYYSDSNLQAIALPYRGMAPLRNDLAMIVLLPSHADGLADLEESLSVKKLNEWFGSMKSRPVDVCLPKFKSTSTLDWCQTLNHMGISDAFSRELADFSGISPIALQEQLHVTAIVHQAMIKVQEKGTEAVAATAAGGGAGGGRMDRDDQPILFLADHPFVYLLYHYPTNTILFMGRTINPVAAN